MYIGKVCMQKCQHYRRSSLFALATLSDGTQIEMILSKHGWDWEKLQSWYWNLPYQFLKVRNRYWKFWNPNWMVFFKWKWYNPRISKNYDSIISDTKYQWCYFEKYRNIIIFCFVDIWLLDTCRVIGIWLLDICSFIVKMIPNQVFFWWKVEIMSVKLVEIQNYVWEKTLNWVFLSETSGKLRLCVKSEVKLIISGLCLFGNMIWL